MGIYLSFTEFTTVTNTTWVGLKNYKALLGSPDFMNALWFTVKFTVVSVLSINLIGIHAGAASDKRDKGNESFSGRYSSCPTS